MNYGKEKHKARCVKSYAMAPPSHDDGRPPPMIAPAQFDKGETLTFSSDHALRVFLAANPGKWERA